MTTPIRHMLKHHAYLNIPLGYEEAFDLAVLALQGCKGDAIALVQSVATMCALHTVATYAWERSEADAQKHEHTLPKNSAEQIAGICAGVFQEDIAKSEFGFLRPMGVPYVLDNSGMGGDLVRTANVSTIACFIAAAAGIPVCKHGSSGSVEPGIPGQHGSSDFIELCGINLLADTKRDLEKSIEELGFGFAEALDVRFKRIHIQTHSLAKLSHMNDIIGPVTHPLDPRLATRKLIGVNHLILPYLVVEAYQHLNAHGITFMEHAVAVRGFSFPGSVAGMDEVSICPGGTLIAELKNGEVSQRHVFAEEFGLKPADVSTIGPPPGVSKGDFSLDILKGNIEGSPLDMVLANAALLFYLDGRSENLRDCTEMAREIHAKGLDYAKMLQVRKRFPLVS